MLASAERQYQDQQRLSVNAAVQCRAAWRGMSSAGLDSSWASVYPRVLRSVLAAQLAAAQLADPYLEASLAEQGITAPTEGNLVPSAFAGAASDGRSIESLLGEPLIQAKSLIQAGATAEQALLSAQSSLLRIVVTQVLDAARVAIGAGIVARPAVQGYIRVLRPPSCSRCAVLAGRWYRYNASFARHPHCDCTSQPAQESGAAELVTDPRAAFRAGQVTGLSKADARAIGDGADFNQVVNAHRTGLAPAGFTSEGTTKRGLAGQRLGKGVARMTPERIYDLYGDDRAGAIEALRKNGYIL